MVAISSSRFSPLIRKFGARVEVEARQLLGDEVEALHRPAVVVLVVADDQLLGHAFDVLRIAAERLHFV